MRRPGAKETIAATREWFKARAADGRTKLGSSVVRS